MLDVSLLEVGTVLHIETDAWVDAQTTAASYKRVPTPKIYIYIYIITAVRIGSKKRRQLWPQLVLEMESKRDDKKKTCHPKLSSVVVFNPRRIYHSNSQ